MIKTKRQDFNHFKINVTNPLLTCYLWSVWCTCYAYVYRPIVEISTSKTTGNLTYVSLPLQVISVLIWKCIKILETLKCRAASRLHLEEESWIIYVVVLLLIKHWQPSRNENLNHPGRDFFIHYWLHLLYHHIASWKAYF